MNTNIHLNINILFNIFVDCNTFLQIFHIFFFVIGNLNMTVFNNNNY